MNIIFIILLLIGGIILGWIAKGVVQEQKEDNCDEDCEKCSSNPDNLNKTNFEKQIDEIQKELSNLNEKINNYINDKDEDEDFMGWSISCKIHSIRELLFMISMNIDEIDSERKEKDNTQIKF